MYNIYLKNICIYIPYLHDIHDYIIYNKNTSYTYTLHIYIYIHIGWIDYQVTGEKPDLFKYTPQIILNSIIHIIEDNIYNFVCLEFEKQYIKAFKYYVLIDKQDKQQGQQRQLQPQQQDKTASAAYKLSIL